MLEIGHIRVLLPIQAGEVVDFAVVEFIADDDADVTGSITRCYILAVCFGADGSVWIGD